MSSTKPRRAFAPAWIAGDASARGLLAGGYEDSAERAAAARRASTHGISTALVEELVDQHRQLPPSRARDRNLDALATGTAAAVVSGQQVGLFTGPAFSLYKAAGVVAAARALASESGVPCVPVFWLQTEDHDWAEIDHCFVRGGNGGPVRIAVDDRETPARVSVSARRYGPSIDAALAQLEAETSPKRFAAETAALLRRHYTPDASPAEAFRGAVGELFADDGLLLFDPRTPRVATLAAPLFERALSDCDSLADALLAQCAAIEAAGFGVQVPVRRGAPLCFFHPDGPAGARFRMEPCEAGWRLCDSTRTVARASALERLRSDPLAASSSALLRPLLQDFLLPTAMYLGGPAELSYFAALAPLYSALAMEMPLVAPRPSFCVTDGGDRRRLEALGLRPDELLEDRESLLLRLTGARDEDVESLLTRGFLADLESFTRRALDVDPALAAPIQSARRAVEHSVERLAEKYRRSVANRDDVTSRRLDALLDALAPGGVPQERRYGFAALASQHGAAPLLAAIADAMVPFDGAMKEIAL